MAFCLCKICYKYIVPNFVIYIEKVSFLSLLIEIYIPPGKSIGSSCGEFTKHYYLEEIETEDEINKFNEWELKHQVFE